MGSVLVARNPDGLRVEPQDLDGDLPRAWGQDQRVLAGFVGVSDKFDVTLAGGYGCPGNEMIGSSNGSAVKGGSQLERTHEHEEEERTGKALHGYLYC